MKKPPFIRPSSRAGFRDPRNSTVITRLDDPALHEKRPRPPGAEMLGADDLEFVDHSLDEEPTITREPATLDEMPGEPVHAEAPPPLQGGSKLIAFFSPRGGTGATTLAVNVAGVLQRYKRTSALVDLNLQLGAIPIALNLTPDRSLAELMAEADAAGHGPFTSGLDRHESGLLVAAQGDRIEELGQITADRLPRFFDAMSHTVRNVIIDGLSDFSDHAVSAMDMAHVVVMVITQDVPAVRSAARALRIFKRLGYDRERVRLVLNRYHKRAPIPVEAIERALARPVDALIHNDFRLVEMALNEGMLVSDLKPNARVATDLDQLARRLVGLEVEASSGGFFARLFGRKG